MTTTSSAYPALSAFGKEFRTYKNQRGTQGNAVTPQDAASCAALGRSRPSSCNGTVCEIQAEVSRSNLALPEGTLVRTALRNEE